MECSVQVLSAGIYDRPYSEQLSVKRIVKDVELDLFLEGNGGITVNEKRYPVGGGMIMLRRPGDTCFSDGAYRCYILTLNFGAYRIPSGKRQRTGELQVLPDNFALADTPVIIKAEPFSVYEDIFRMFCVLHLEEDKEAEREGMRELLLRLQADTLRIRNRERESRKMEALHPAVQKAVIWMNEHYRENMSLEQLGKITCFHPRYLHRVFSEQMKTTPLKYLQQIRLSRARLLLRDTAEPIKWIAEVCGFSSASYFTQSFHHEFGISPRDYRNGT